MQINRRCKGHFRPVDPRGLKTSLYAWAMRQLRPTARDATQVRSFASSGWLRFAVERPKCFWRPPMLGSGFVGRCNFEQERFVKRTRQKFHGNGHLVGL